MQITYGRLRNLQRCSMFTWNIYSFFLFNLYDINPLYVSLASVIKKSFSILIEVYTVFIALYRAIINC